MPQIHILDRSVAELIAAGEVVERPASVIKELVENSIDAGAGKVTVEIKNGGISYIRVTDDGCGIAPEDVPRAFVRHATSKVLTVEDLSAIGTFGFRGEALASVSAMCRVELLSRTAEQVAGTRYVIEGGVETICEETGCPVGTTLVVRDLFYNTPARMKFLKKDSTEGMNVSAVLEKLALANPGVALRFIKDGEVRLNTPGNGDLLAAIHAVYGREMTATLIPVDGSLGALRVRGYISAPKGARATRNLQNFFINTRFVKSKTCTAALEEAYKSSLMVGKFPSSVLNVTIPYDTVDVNVHPAKIEVRFSNEKLVFDAVVTACKEALGAYERENSPLGHEPQKQGMSPFALRDFDHSDRQQRFTPEAYRQMVAKPEGGERPTQSFGNVGKTVSPAAHSTWERGAGTGPRGITPQERARPTGAMGFLTEEHIPYKSGPARPPLTWEEEAPAPAPQRPPVSVPVMGERAAPISQKAGGEEAAPPLTGEGEVRSARVIGELFATYILIQYGESLVLIDKHAAHERYLYNELKAAAQNGASRQVLLTPISVSLSKLEYSAVLENLDTLGQMGFLVEDFGEGTVRVREIPTMMGEGAVSDAVSEVAEGLLRCKGDLLPSVLEELYHSIACRSAIKGGGKSSSWELAELVALIEAREDLHHCPHGRPVAVTLTRRELEKLFGRLG